MHVITSFLLQFRHLLTHGRWFTVAVLVLFIGLEMYGRRVATDIHDTVGAVMLILILAGIAVRHRSRPIGWVKRLGGLVWKLARLAGWFKVEIGPDLRGVPRLPARFPFVVHAAGCGLSLWLAGAAITWSYCPEGWRPHVVVVSYTLYLALMGLLWGLLFVCSLGGVYIPIMLVSRLSKSGPVGDLKITRGQMIAVGAYLFVTTVAAWTLPLWPTMAFAGLCWLMVLGLNLLPDRPGAQLIWRSPGSRTVYSVTMRRLLLAMATLFVLLLGALIMSAAGGHLYGHSEALNTMPLTGVMGNWVAWLTPGLLVSVGIFVYLTWQNSPARPGLPRVYLGGVRRPERRTCAAAVRRQGWVPVFENPRPSDVRIRLVHPEASELYEFNPTWPLAVSLAELNNGFLWERLSRRREIQLRRLFLRGLEKLFRFAQGRTRVGGCGYWLAPHLWFVTGLTRDEVNAGEDEPSFLTEIVGRPYAEVFALPVRRYLYQVLKSLDIDLIFVEDGVGYRKLTRVFRVLFEIFDKGAGRQRSEDVHFRGLTRLRVLFHEIDIDEPFRSHRYPEPKFAPLGRLRVMHVFRDRGGEEEFIEPPAGSDQSPVPVLLTS